MYKPGDMVVIRNDLDAGVCYGKNELSFVSKMLPFKNRTAHVTRMIGGDVDWFSLDVDHGRFTWCPEMVSHVNQHTYPTSAETMENYRNQSAAFSKCCQNKRRKI